MSRKTLSQMTFYSNSAGKYTNRKLRHGLRLTHMHPYT